MPSAATFFDNAPIIHCYTREDGLADGSIVDAKKGETRYMTQQHFGRTPVYWTAALRALVQRAVDDHRHCNDWDGVSHDIYWLAKVFAIKLGLKAGRHRTYRVIITGTGRRRNHTLAVGFDGQALTFGLPEDF